MASIYLFSFLGATICFVWKLIFIFDIVFIIYQNRYNHEECPEVITSQIKIHASYKSIEARQLFHIVEIFVFIKKEEKKKEGDLKKYYFLDARR